MVFFTSALWEPCQECQKVWALLVKILRRAKLSSSTRIDYFHDRICFQHNSNLSSDQFEKPDCVELNFEATTWSSFCFHHRVSFSTHSNLNHGNIVIGSLMLLLENISMEKFLIALLAIVVSTSVFFSFLPCPEDNN